MLRWDGPWCGHGGGGRNDRRSDRVGASLAWASCRAWSTPASELGLLVRGTGAGGLAAAAETALPASGSTRIATPTTGGSSARAATLCLQYWFFYAMNDWRSSFGGINDHEADWEHDHRLPGPSGPTGRRSRPGSPSPPTTKSATTCAADGMTPTCSCSRRSPGGLRRRRLALRRLRRRRLRHRGRSARAALDDHVSCTRAQRLLTPWRDVAHPTAGFGIPFVDYARGDGGSIGPGLDAGLVAGR